MHTYYSVSSFGHGILCLVGAKKGTILTAYFIINNSVKIFYFCARHLSPNETQATCRCRPIKTKLEYHFGIQRPFYCILIKCPIRD